MWQKLLIIPVLLSVMLHFWLIDRMPVSFTPDELEVILSGYTYANYGVDLAGYGLPMSLWATQTHGVISPLPPLVYAALWMIVEPLSTNLMLVSAARVVPIMLMIGTAFFLYRLSVLLFAKRTLAVLVALYFLLTPWQWHYAHYAADTPFALFFFISGAYYLLREQRRAWWTGLILLVAGFFSYHGAKLLFAPLLGICVLFHFYRDGLFIDQVKDRRAKVKNLLIELLPVVIVGFGFFVVYLIVLFAMRDSIVAQRGTQLFFLNDAKMSEEVNYLRQRVLPSPLATVMVNKVTLAVTILVSNYLTSFSPDVLFVAGDTSTVNRWYVHGLLYRWDAILLLIGLVFLWQRSRRTAYLVFGLIALAPIPSAVSNFSASVIHRSFLLAALLPMLSAVGLYALWKWLHQSIKLVSVRWFGYFVVSGLLTIQVGNYLFSYYYRLPLINPDGQYWGDRVLAAYLERRSNNTYVATGEPRAQVLAYLMQSDAQTRRKFLVPGQLADLQDTFVLDNLTLSARCPTKEKEINTTYVIARDLQHCYDKDRFAAILSPKDGGIYFRIYGDELCRDFQLQGFTYPFVREDFTFYPDNKEKFCKRWISDPVQI